MQEFSSQLCIVGAGPAGMTVAREFINSGIDIIIVESGDVTDLPQAQALNEGNTEGFAYAGLRATRHRGLGGTVRMWNTLVEGDVGAKYVPLDPADLASCPAGAPGWPIGYADLLPFYVRAQDACGLGPFRYDAEAWRSVEAAPFDLAQTSLTNKVYQFGRASRWLEDHLVSISHADNIRVLPRTTAGHFLPDGTSGPRRLRVKDTVTGAEATVCADIFVLAGGAIENARLLMLSDIGSQAAREGWLGRCFMEHPRDGSLRIAPADPGAIDRAAFYDMRRAPDGTVVGGRLGPRDDLPRAGNEPNFSVTLLPQPPASGLARRLLERIGIERAHRGYGWSGSPRPSRDYQYLGLLVNLEQFPSRENRVDLSTVHDHLGYPRARLCLNWREDEQQAADEVAARIDVALSQAGLGNLERLISAPVDLNAHHHAGTTRMGLSEQDGVVDPDCRVFGTDDVYVAGASVFPTAGYANPVLTIVALAIRLADTLKQRLCGGVRPHSVP